MEPVKTWLAEGFKNRRCVRLCCLVAALFLALCAALCISIYMRSNMQRKYSNAIAQLQEQSYQALIEMDSLFSRIDDPSVDVRYKLMPELRAQYAAVTAINAVLSQSFGQSCAVLASAQIEAFDAAFEAYNTAYRLGIATGLAQADMAECMQSVRLMIDARYAPEDEDKDVVYVNADAAAK